jgi:hypothetical protein
VQEAHSPHGAVTICLQRLAQELPSIQPTPVGRKTRFSHSDGLVAEYVDHPALPEG